MLNFKVLFSCHFSYILNAVRLTEQFVTLGFVTLRLGCTILAEFHRNHSVVCPGEYSYSFFFLLE